MIRVAALTSGPCVPSARFRVRQHIPALRQLDVEVRDYSLPFSKYASPRRSRLGPAWTAAKTAARVPGIIASRRVDVVWLERELLPGRAGLERLTGAPRVFDVDDAIWLLAEGVDFSLEIARRSACVIAGNAFIAEHFAGAGVPVWMIPTAVDTRRWHPDPDRVDGRHMVIGWTGSASTQPFLAALSGPLAEVAQARPGVRLRVVSDLRPELPGFPAERLDWQPWSPDVEAEAVRGMDVGVLPQPDSPWTRGKCSLKMLQYMACGLPTVASPVGHAGELLERGAGLPASTPGEWTDVLLSLIDDARMRDALGMRGRAIAEDEYAASVVAGRLAEVLRSARR